MSFKLLFMITVLVLTTKAQNEDVYTDGSALGQEIPRYAFGYGVQDYQTGNVKSARELKEGDVVHGHYRFLEPNDSTVRSVQYTADPESGFKAVVKTKPLIVELSPSEKNETSNIEKKSSGDYGEFDVMFGLPKYQPLIRTDQMVKSKQYDPFTPNLESLYAEHKYNDYPGKKITEYDYKPIFLTAKSPKRKTVTGKSINKDTYSKIIEIDLTKNFEQDDEPTDIRGKVIMKDYPVELIDEKDYNAHKNIDIQKLISPFSINGHFQMPKLLETGFQPILESASDENFDVAENSNIYESLIAMDISKIHPEMISDRPSTTPFRHFNKNLDIESHTTPRIYHYTNRNIYNDYNILPKKRFKMNTNIINPQFEMFSYYPSIDVDNHKIETKPERPVYNNFGSFRNTYENKYNRRTPSVKYRKPERSHFDQIRRKPEITYSPSKLYY